MFPAMNLLSVGDQVGPGIYAVHSRFKRVVNFSNGRRFVFLAIEDIGAGPLSIVLADAGSQRALARISSLRVEEHLLQVDEHRFNRDCIERYRSDFTLQDCTADRLSLNLESFRQLLTEASAANSLAFLIAAGRVGNFTSSLDRAFVSRIQRGADQIFGGSLLDGVSMLKGCGAGLTPSGDDFIAGMLIGLHFVQQLRRRELRRVIDAVFRVATGDNIFSNTFLDLAGRGLLFEKMKKLIMALPGGESGAVRAAVLDLFAIGATSGADLATGLFMTLLEENGAVTRWKREAASL
ncbi:MAG: DUF2877 domain-containing protein [Candidatus Korobacteraceae bacterium]|jgi:hypothetical protein